MNQLLSMDFIYLKKELLSIKMDACSKKMAIDFHRNPPQIIIKWYTGTEAMPFTKLMTSAIK